MHSGDVALSTALVDEAELSSAITPLLMESR
jgi:hypothetical protein